MTARFQVPKQTINFIVDKYHVGTSDDIIRADVRRRVDLMTARRMAGFCTGFRPMTQHQIKRMEDYAIKRHRENGELYNRVMGGI
jgi:hypothetical protein